MQAFVVVSQGELQMFRFDGAGGGGTSRAMGGVGGGDWTVRRLSRSFSSRPVSPS